MTWLDANDHQYAVIDLRESLLEFEEMLTDILAAQAVKCLVQVRQRVDYSSRLPIHFGEPNKIRHEEIFEFDGQLAPDLDRQRIHPPMLGESFVEEFSEQRRLFFHPSSIKGA